MPVFILQRKRAFPPVERAEPEGLLAAGGDLSVERLLLAYRSGIFPWYEEGQPILWWSPDPRCVLVPEKVKVSDSMRRLLRKGAFSVTCDRDFRGVMRRCARAPRRGQPGTWITDAMWEAYGRLHDAGYAHSIETRVEGRLAGGLYGVSMGRCFFGESMFADVANASKFALIWLAHELQARGFGFIDSQVYTAHMAAMGAELIPRRRYLEWLAKGLEADTLRGNWGAVLGPSPTV